MQAWSPQEKPQDCTNWQLWVCLFSIDSISGKKKDKTHEPMSESCDYWTEQALTSKVAPRPFVAWFWLVPQNLFSICFWTICFNLFALRLKRRKQPTNTPGNILEIVNVISRIANKIYLFVILFKPVWGFSLLSLKGTKHSHFKQSCIEHATMDGVLQFETHWQRGRILSLTFKRSLPNFKIISPQVVTGFEFYSAALRFGNVY